MSSNREGRRYKSSASKLNITRVLPWQLTQFTAGLEIQPYWMCRCRPRFISQPKFTFSILELHFPICRFLRILLPTDDATSDAEISRIALPLNENALELSSRSKGIKRTQMETRRKIESVSDIGIAILQHKKYF